MIRMETLKKINKLLDVSEECEIRKQMNLTNGSKFSRTDGYCNTQCSIGKDLQAIGKTLN